MGILGLLLGAGVTVAVLFFMTTLPLAWARSVAILAALALIVVLFSILFATGNLERSFGTVYLTLSVLAAVILSLPRLLKCVGLEPVWVSLGLGVAALLVLIGVSIGVYAVLEALLPPDTQTGILVKTQVSQGIINGVLLAAPVVLIVLAWLAWRQRMARRVS